MSLTKGNTKKVTKIRILPERVEFYSIESESKIFMIDGKLKLQKILTIRT